MAGWDNSTRGQQLPPGWAKTRRRVFRRDGHRCRWTDDHGNRCPHTDPDGRTIECDHIGDRHDHTLPNLQTLCGAGSPHNHHQAKTLAERRPPRQRPTQPHPGLL